MKKKKRGIQGVEPKSVAPEATILPLNYIPMILIIDNSNLKNRGKTGNYHKLN
jgi:hypothetical protein